MRIPLYNRLRRQLHRDIALVQDQVAEVVYTLQNDAVLHGGTAIWRCFGGARFSEDLDFYFVPVKGFEESLGKELSANGLELTKYKETDNTLYSKILSGSVTVQLEVALRKFRKPIVKEYEKIDGTYIDVFTLSPEELFVEKIEAYNKRRLVRDIYDVYHLSNYVEKGFAEKAGLLLQNLPAPLDEKNLKTLILYGAVPSYEQIITSLKRRFPE